MINKNNVKNLVTKGYLKKELTVVRRDMEASLKEEIDRLENRVKLMIDDLKLDIDEKNRQYRDELLVAIDPILKEILIAREERAVASHQIEELRDRIDKHEDRLKQLQQSRR